MPPHSVDDAQSSPERLVTPSRLLHSTRYPVKREPEMEVAVPTAIDKQASTNNPTKEGCEGAGFFKFPGFTRDKETSTWDLCNESAYCFLLIPNLWSYLFVALVFSSQIYALFLLGFAGVERINDQAWDAFRPACGGFDSEPICEQVTTYSWPAFAGSLALLSCGTFPHMVRGLQLILRTSPCGWYRSPLFYIGLANVFVSCFCWAVGFITAYSTRIPAEMLVNAVSSLFIEQVDEQMYDWFECWSPVWYKEQMEELKKGDKPTGEQVDDPTETKV